MITELLRKWFGLTEPVCHTCELLRDQLDESNRERRELLQRLLDLGINKTESLPPVEKEEPVPVRPNFVPWRVRQQALEAEDRQKALLLKDRTREINELEKELGIQEEAK